MPDIRLQVLYPTAPIGQALAVEGASIDEWLDFSLKEVGNVISNIVRVCNDCFEEIAHGLEIFLIFANGEGRGLCTSRKAKMKRRYASIFIKVR